MAKTQRGETISVKKKANNEKSIQKMNLSLESSDDEAPEEVTFEDSKAQALQSMKQALDTARRERELLKEKRRKKQELFQEQKKKKLLPAEVLEEIDLSPSKKQKQSEKEAEEEEEEGEKAEGENKKERTKLPHVRKLKGNYTVRTVAETEEASFQRKTAEDFIQSRLYGPGSCRSTNNEVLSLQNKTGKNKSAAVNFVKKDWASKKKAKAERLKRRWIHEQQIPPC